MLDDLPKNNAEIVELAIWSKEKYKADPEAHQMFVSYLLTHGFGRLRLRLRNVLMPVWKEAADCIELRGEELHRATMSILPLTTRRDAMRYLNGAVKDAGLPEDSCAILLEEWDALHFPKQLPPPIRERALKRYRFETGQEDASA